MTAVAVSAHGSTWDSQERDEGQRRRALHYRREEERLVDMMRVAAPGIWHRRAACRLMTPDVFRTRPGNSGGLDEAVSRCAMCPVALQCLDEALRLELGGVSEAGGEVRAGFTAQQRAAIRLGRPPKRRLWSFQKALIDEWIALQVREAS